MKAKRSTDLRRYSGPLGKAALGVVALAAALLLLARAWDTGSLQQYSLTLVLLFFAANRLFTVRRRRTT